MALVGGWRLDPLLFQSAQQNMSSEKPFKQKYECCPASSSIKKPQLESGDKKDEKRKRLKFDPHLDDLKFTHQGIEYTMASKISSKLFPHQREGIKWLWNLHCTDGGGGILADDMGLGKTVTVCSFLAGLFSSSLIKRVMIIGLPTILPHWTNELSGVGLSDITKGYYSVQIDDRPQELEEFLKDHDKGILLTSYGIATNDIEALKGGMSETEFKWDYVILDEGKFVKNAETIRSRSLNKLQSSHCIIITGTPLQNSLKELWALFKFCFEGLLGSYEQFRQMYESRMLKAADKRASEKERSYRDVTNVLKDVIGPHFLRRSESLISSHDKDSPIKKQELVVWLRLTKCQRDLYECLLKEYNDFSPSGDSPLPALSMLRTTCDYWYSKQHRLTNKINCAIFIL